MTISRTTLLGALVLATTATAAFSLTLTPAGVADGFTLTNFVTGFGVGAGGIGPLGVAVASNGNVIVDASNLSANYVFSDVDGQNLTSAISHTAFNAFPPAYTATAGAVWGSGGFSGPNAGKLIKFNNDGSINTVFTIAGLNISNGMWTDPVNGHIIASGGAIYDIDVSGATPTFRVVNNNGADGLTVTPDGTTVYTSSGAGYSLTTGALVKGPFSVSGADGIGVITSSNSLNGDLIVNSNNGIVVLVDPSNGAQTIIANGGTRGDYVAPDPTNGSLFLTQSNDIFRLSCGEGCAIGAPPPPPSGAPEPASAGLMIGGFGGIAIALFNRKRRG